MNTERILILDHENHSVFIEDLDMNLINEKYDGEEEQYILDNYNLGEYWTWDYITNIQYIDRNESDPIEIDIDSVLD